MASIRTAVVTLPPITLDIIATLLPNPTVLNVVARLHDRADLEARLAAVSPDLVLFGTQSGETDNGARALLNVLPRTTIIALSDDGRDAVIHEMRPHRRTLRNVSPSVLVRAILAKTAHSAI